MGNAFIKGLSHTVDNQIHVVEPVSSVKAKLKNDFDVMVSDNDDPVKQMGEMVPLCDYILICVKPQAFNEIKEALKNLLSDNQIVISIMAGIREELDLADVPKPFQGAAITLIVAGILALAFMGFSGMISV